MKERKSCTKKWLAVAVVLMIISIIGAGLVQNNFGKVKVKDIRFETTLGKNMSGLLFVPKELGDEPLPAIVVSHGMYNNREMQDLNFVELSRRGFVVFSMDMLSHGHSENVATSAEILPGMYEAVKMLASLSYVDSDRIGITGHSLGGMSSNVAVSLDNQAEKQLINAVLLNCADATYKDEEAYANIYGNRNVGILAAQYDEWFFRQADKDGNITAPRDFIDNSNAQSFLYYGADPSELEKRLNDTVYTENIDGKQAMRVVYTPSIIHPWSHFSSRSTKATIEFFDQALGAPNSIASGNQVWQWKVAFNLLGLVGFFIFLVNFAIAMLNTKFFADLKASKPVEKVMLADKKSKLWFWGSILLAAAFATLLYLPILKGMKGHITFKNPWKQSSPAGVGAWAAACGLFSILSMIVSYKVFKKSGTAIDLKDRGVIISLSKLCKSILLALVTLAGSYVWVFVADYFFKVDFRVWVFALKAFGPEKLVVALFPSVILFLIFYVANSVAVNSFNYNNICKKEWLNTVLLAIFNGLPAIILLILQYTYFNKTGHLLYASNMYVVWLFPMLVVLPGSAIISRKIYKHTGNPYLPGIINGILVTIISCANTLTWL